MLAAGVGPWDAELRRGGWSGPLPYIPGGDFAGLVERLAPIPAGLTAVEAAAVAIDGLTAERGLADILHVTAGDQILITAAAVGLRHFAVQIARTLGAVVVATASPRHHVFVHGSARLWSSTTPTRAGPIRSAR